MIFKKKLVFCTPDSDGRRLHLLGNMASLVATTNVNSLRPEWAWVGSFDVSMNELPIQSNRSSADINKL